MIVDFPPKKKELHFIVLSHRYLYILITVTRDIQCLNARNRRAIVLGCNFVSFYAMYNL